VQFLSVLDSDAAFNSEIIRECYEAFALYCFERYLIACLGMSNLLYDHKFPLTVPVIFVLIYFPKVLNDEIFYWNFLHLLPSIFKLLQNLIPECYKS